MAAVTCSDFGAHKNKVCHCFHCLLIYLPWSDGTGWSLCFEYCFKPAFSLYIFTLIKKLFRPSLLSPIKVVSSAGTIWGWCHHLMLLIFFPVILIPACNTSSLAFCMMYSEYKLNKLSDNIQSFHFPCHVTCFNEWRNRFKKTWNQIALDCYHIRTWKEIVFIFILISLFGDKNYCSANFILSYENHFSHYFFP